MKITTGNVVASVEVLAVRVNDSEKIFEEEFFGDVKIIAVLV